jgi:hypothetical protein
MPADRGKRRLPASAAFERRANKEIELLLDWIGDLRTDVAIGAELSKQAGEHAKPT